MVHAANATHSEKMGRVLIVAGSDPSGGAGIQADIKTVTMLGHYAATAITAVTVQNTLGVSDAVGLAPELVLAQIMAVLNDIGADVVKTGMLHSVGIVDCVIEGLEKAKFSGALVVDPVMVATSGDKLLDDDAITSVRVRLIPHANLVTPNIPEAEVLCGMKVKTRANVEEAGRIIMSMGADAVLMKGGHMQGNTLTDILFFEGGIAEIMTKKIITKHTHGTGCTMASACAALMAGGASVEQAFRGAHAFVQSAIKAAPGLGAGHGPLGHAHVRGSE